MRLRRRETLQQMNSVTLSYFSPCYYSSSPSIYRYTHFLPKQASQPAPGALLWLRGAAPSLRCSYFFPNRPPSQPPPPLCGSAAMLHPSAPLKSITVQATLSVV